MERKIGKKHIVDITFDKITLDNGKEGRSLIIQLISAKKQAVYFIQVDRAIWWLPKRIKDDGDNYKGRSIGWLFAQTGYIKFI